MSHQSQLEKLQYRNWVKGALAYKYLKEGIEGFADDVVQKEHTRVLGVVNNTTGTACKQCDLKSLRRTRKCTNNMCNIIMDEIEKSHVSAPNWKNIDVHKWYTCPWEIAKCFIHASGYSDKTKAADIDASGLLHVFINNKNLHTHLSCNMTGKNIFIKCREGRNKLFHSPAMELENTELTKCIDDIIAILEDPKELAPTADAQQAVLKLKELKQQDFIITTDHEAEVCRDALAYITNKTLELKQMIQETKDGIDKRHADALNREDALKNIRDIDLTIQSVQSLIKRMDKKVDHSQIREGLFDQTKIIEELKDKHGQLQYLVDKKELQRKLVELYQRHYVKTSLSPLKHQENDINIDEVYVEPNMVVVEADKQQTGAGNSRRETGKHKERYIHGYHDLFQSEEKENKAIYIVGDVGSGKSSFCKKMIQDWCKSATENLNICVSTHGGSTSCEMTDDSNTIGTFGATHELKKLFYDLEYTHDIYESGSDSDQESENMSSDKVGKNVVQMRKYDFLFYISLRKMSTFCDISKMIQAICTRTNLASTELIEKVFAQDSERCLIVIDGLDEWRPQQMDTILSHESFGLPLKHGVNNATVVTLSRPSAKGMLSITSSEIDQKVELKGIMSSSVNSLIQKYLSKQINTSMSYKKIKNKIKQSRLKHLDKSPLLLQQLVWLFCNGYDFGTSVSSIYCHLINIMFTWFETKTNASDSEGECCDNAEQYDTMTLPPILNSLHHCEKNKGLLIQLSRVAFESLKSKTENKTFSRSGLKRKGFSKTAISSLIEIGLLVEENCYDPTQEKTQLSFIHMSYYEFFAAVYASCQFDEKQSDKNTSVLTEIFQNCKTAADTLQLSNLLKMICGLCPFVITQVSHFISEIVKMDENPMRQHSEKLSRDSPLHQIQELILSFLSECDPTVKTDTMVYIADVLLLHGSIKLSAIKSIIPDNVISLIVREYLCEEIWKRMTQMKHLQCLDLQFVIEPSHDQMTMLCSFIKEAPLRCISLERASCRQQDCIGHSIDLSKHDHLQKLSVCDRIKISNINTEHLEAIQLPSPQTLDIGLLQNSKRLSELHLGLLKYHMQTSHLRLKYNKDVDTVVHTLHQLQTLELSHADIDENVLTVTPEMRNLNHIKLHNVKMSLETWRTFVDSLHTLQQSVQVDTYCVSIFDNGLENLQEKKKYVEGKGNMVEIILDISHNVINTPTSLLQEINVEEVPTTRL